MAVLGLMEVLLPAMLMVKVIQLQENTSFTTDHHHGLETGMNKLQLITAIKPSQIPGSDPQSTKYLIVPIFIFFALMVFAMAVVMSLFFLLLDQVLKFFLELLLKVSI